MVKGNNLLFPSIIFSRENGISQLKKLKVLQCDSNGKIFDVNHLEVLTVLRCSGRRSGIGQSGISKLTKVKALDCSGNKEIMCLDHLHKTLLVLNNKNSGCENKYKLRNPKKFNTFFWSRQRNA